MRRFILLTDTLMIDVFSVSKAKCLWGNKITWDWLLHCRGVMSTNMSSSACKDPLGSKNGYQYLENLKKINASPSISAFDFSWPDKRFLRAFFPGKKGEVYFGTGTGVRVNEKVPFILRRRNNLRETFVAIYDFSGDGSSVKDIRLVEVLDSNGKRKKNSVGIVFKNADGHETQIGINMNNNVSAEWLTFMGSRFKRLQFLIKQ